MAKRYLSLEEAADLLGISTDDVKRLRERGELRGFADRHTWKFKEEDIQEYGRRKQADSDPEVPIFNDSEITSDSEPRSSMVLGGGPGSSTVLGDDEAAPGDQPTIVRGFPGGTSDSDVRLIFDDSLSAGDEGSDPELELGESDSDVRLFDNVKSQVDSGSSDSDVQLLAASDSDVTLVPKKKSDSDVQIVGADTDSDVKLVGKPGKKSDSDVKFTGGDTEGDMNLMSRSDANVDLTANSESDISLLGDSDSDVRLDEESSKISLSYGSDSEVRLVANDSDSDVQLSAKPAPGSESDISLLAGTDGDIRLHGGDDDDEAESVFSDDDQSGIALERAADSGISLESADTEGIGLPGDSGITLEDDDSGIALDPLDSGIALEGLSSSGISLSRDSEATIADDDEINAPLLQDSGLSLDAVGDLETQEIEGTVPMFEMDDDSSAGLNETQLEVDAPQSEFEFAVEDEEGGDTSVLLFDDEEEHDDSSATLMRRGADEDEVETLDSDTFSLESMAEVDAVEEGEGEFEGDGTDYDLEVSEGQTDSEEALDLGDFGSEEEDMFASDEFGGSGEMSESDFEPLRTVPTATAPVEAEWGVWAIVPLIGSTIAMILLCAVTFDLVRSMWTFQESNAFSSFLLDNLKGYF